MAETIALAKLVVKVRYMRGKETMINSTRVWADNTAAIAVATGHDLYT